METMVVVLLAVFALGLVADMASAPKCPASAKQRTILVIAGLIVVTFTIFATRSFFKVK